MIKIENDLNIYLPLVLGGIGMFLPIEITFIQFIVLVIFVAIILFRFFPDPFIALILSILIVILIDDAQGITTEIIIGLIVGILLFFISWVFRKNEEQKKEQEKLEDRFRKLEDSILKIESKFDVLIEMFSGLGTDKIKESKEKKD